MQNDLMESDPSKDRVIKNLLEELPDFAPTYYRLLEDYGDELTLQVVFSALSEVVTDIIDSDDPNHKRLINYLAAIENLAGHTELDLYEEIAYCFFDNFDENHLEIIEYFLTPNLLAIYQSLLEDDF